MEKEGARKGHSGPPPLVPDRQYVNIKQEDQMEIQGYGVHRARRVLTWVFIILTVGLLRLIFYWKPNWFIKCTHKKTSLREASKVLLKDQYEQQLVETIITPSKDHRDQGHKLSSQTSSLHGNQGVKDQVDLDDVPGSASANHLIASSSSSPECSAHDLKEQESPLLQCSDYSIYFVNKKLKYVWNPQEECFEKLKGLEDNLSCAYFHEASALSYKQQSEQKAVYGDNLIDVKVEPILKIIFTQALNPFYVFQVFSCSLWFYDEYYYYASAIVLISIISLATETYQTHTMQVALQSTIQGSDIVSVCRDTGEYNDILSDQLVPGDIIEIPRHGCFMQCDAVLITGNCIVNESMLTGESVPVTKTPIPNPRHQKTDILFSFKDHSRHILFCGTKVIQTRYYGNQKVRALVVRTGFSTAKGELVRSILFPKPLDFKFSQDAFKFIGVLSLVASVGMVYTIVVMTAQGWDVSLIVVRSLDLITIAIPPALPAAMTIGVVFAQSRLKSRNVFCISPKSISLCGALDTFCFDKTGTLTEDGLDLQCIVPVKESKFQPAETGVEKMGRDPIVAAMATCHSLTIIEGEISGDPLDVKMFESTGWDLEEPGEDTSKFDVFMPTVVRPKKPDVVTMSEGFESSVNFPYEVGIMRQFTFSSKLQRMSVIARTLGNDHFDLYAKGAPEMIASLSTPESLPFDFHDQLVYYTQQGYRVLALAWKPLKKLSYVKVQRAQREQMEVDLTFLGLLIMENRLKPETTPVIRQLYDANIRTIMVTGDNMLTALSVAHDCEMIRKKDKVILVHVLPPVAHQLASIEWTYAEDAREAVKEVQMLDTTQAISIQIEPGDKIHFAITGKSWMLIRRHFPNVLPKLAVRGTVFARFSPEQKQQLVELLQEMGYYVGMCGDGANDCGALRTAHTGISLSEAEASVASPFTSKTPNISCVPTVIKEGRAALVTSFGVFKYMACYSLTQFISVCLLYWIGANLTDFTFLYIDLFLITSLGATFSYTGAYPELVPRPPPVSLLTLTPLLSILLQMIVMAAFQIVFYFYLFLQPWFTPFVANDEDDYACHEVTALFAISSYQYVTSAIALSKGPPYRKTMFSNWIFLANIFICTASNIWMTTYPPDALAEFLELVLPPSIPFRLMFLGLGIINFFMVFLIETYVLDSKLFQEKVEDKLEARNKRRTCAYLGVEEELKSRPEWPPVSQSMQGLANLLKMESVTNDASAATHDDDDDAADATGGAGIVSAAYSDDDSSRGGSAYKRSPPAGDYPGSPTDPSTPLVLATGNGVKSETKL